MVKELVKEWVMKADEKTKRTHWYGRYIWYPKKRPSLGENHQAVVNNDLNNERDNISTLHGTLSEINGESVKKDWEGKTYFTILSQNAFLNNFIEQVWQSTL